MFWVKNKMLIDFCLPALGREHHQNLNFGLQSLELTQKILDFFNRHSDSEEAVSDLNRNLSTIEYRAKFLERENSSLQDRIDTLSRQRVALEKLVREYRLEKQKEVRERYSCEDYENRYS